MAKSRNDIEVEDITKTSQYDGQQVLKDVHSLPGHYLRVRDSLSLVPEYFDSYTVEYNADNLPETICYQKGVKAHTTEIGFLADTNSSLNSTYFFITEARTGREFVIYYSVDGLGVDPNIAGKTSLRVDIIENDPAQIVAAATKLVLESNTSDSYEITAKNSVLTIENISLGLTNNTTDFNTGFTISNTSGENVLIRKIEIAYDPDGNPIYKGTTLKGYTYNVGNGKFEITNITSTDLTTIVQEPKIENIAVANANQEIMINLDNEVKRFEIRNRDNIRMKISFTQGESGTNYFTIKQGTVYSEKNLLLENKTIYIQTEKNNSTIELLSWK